MIGNIDRQAEASRQRGLHRVWTTNINVSVWGRANWPPATPYIGWTIDHAAACRAHRQKCACGAGFNEPHVDSCKAWGEVE